LILTPDDTLVKKGKTQPVARDNVLFELGLFIGRLGRGKTFILMENSVDMHLPTDLLGVTAARFTFCEQDKDLPAELGPTCFQIHDAVSEALSRNSLLTEVQKCARRLIEENAPNFKEDMNDTVYVMVPRILKLVYEEEYCVDYDRQIVIYPDEQGNEFIIETSTSKTIHTKKDAYGSGLITWFRSEDNMNSTELIKFSLDGEDRLEEFDASVETVRRSERDYFNHVGARHKPLPYRKNGPVPTVEIASRNIRRAQGFYKMHACLDIAAKNVSVTLQISGPHAMRWALNVSPFTAFRYSDSPYANEYRHKNTTQQNFQINFSGWALPGWGYNYLVRPAVSGKQI
jgi:hypothetical protein